MIWAACAIAFFGFIRPSEFTIPSQSQFDPNLYLTLSDITLDSRHSPQIIQVNIKQSKTNPFHRGITLSMGRTGHNICPVKAIVPFLAARGKGPGPLFQLQNQQMLTRKRFSAALDKILTRLHLDKNQFNTHMK